MKTIGQRLKNKRLEKNLSLEDVYKNIKIHPRVLTALENDTAQKKLNRFYIKNFLYAYAEFLGLETSQITDEYLNFHKANPNPFSQAAEQINILAFFKNPKSRIVFILFLVVFIFGLFPVFKPKQNAVPLKIKAEYPTSENFTDKTIHRTGFPKIDEEQRLKLVVRVKNEVWMQVKSDEKIIFEGNLKKGGIRYWTAGDCFELWVSDGKGLELELNKQLLGSLGAGAIKNIVITRQGMENSGGK